MPSSAPNSSDFLDHPADDPAVDKRIARTRAAIGAAVRQLFADEGWDAVTHQRIAERSGVGRNTVYRHFPDRTTLLLHAGHFDEVHHAPRTGDLRTDLVEELKAFRRELFDGIVGNVIAAMVERADHDPEIGPMRDALVEAGARQTVALINEAIDDGRMTDALPVTDLVAILCGPLVYARLCTGLAPSDRALGHLVDTNLAPP